MTIVAGELKWYKSQTVTNTDANGGKSSYNEIVDGVKNNIFDDVSEADRQAGATFYRKVFAKLRNSAGDVLVNPMQHMKSFTPGEDRVFLFPGTQDDTQVTAIAGEPSVLFGCCKNLAGDVTAGATTCTGVLEDTSDAIFDEVSGNAIYITDGTNEEYFFNVDASKSGDQVTLTLDTGFQFANSYVAANTVVASVMTQSTMEPVVDSVTAATASDGDYDDTGTPIELDNMGAVKDTFTLTFTSATAFDVTNENLDDLGSGTISGDFTATNPNSGGGNYLIVRSAGWTGTWATNDTLIIETSAAEQGVWVKQVVPAGAASYSGNNFVLRHAGESA